MSKHKPFKNIQDIKEQEVYLSKLIKEQHDNELRERWHSIVKSKNQPDQIVDRKHSYLKIIAVIAILTLLAFLASKFLTQNHIEPSFYALQELNVPINDPRLTKGINSDIEDRKIAIKYFNEKDFKQASSYFENISEPTEEDAFYKAMAYLYSDEYNKSIRLLTPISDSNSDLSQEAKWYLSMALILNNSLPEANDILIQIQPKDWNYQKAQEVIKSIENVN